jgi:hypothetical protein
MRGFLLLFILIGVAALMLGFCDTQAQAAETAPMQMMMATTAISAPVPGGDCAAGVCYTVAATCKSGSCSTVTARQIQPVRKTVKATGTVVRGVIRVRKWPLIRRFRLRQSCCR